MKIFFKALKVEVQLREKLLEAIQKSPMQIQQVLTTPLMLTLLNMTFGTSTYIPDTLHEFYEAMFHVLVSRHDETKTGFIRQKVTKLSSGELQNVFEHFCYLSKDYGNSLSDEQFADCSKNASKLTNLEFSSEGLKAELSETLCLMMKEGLKISFIHKSVQEFFAAYFVKKLGYEENVKKIYTHLRQSKFLSWAQELRFLAEIDKYRYLEHFRIPDIQDFQNCIQYKTTSKTKITQKNFKSFISNLEIYFIFPKVEQKGQTKVILLEVSTLTPTLDEWIRKMQIAQKFGLSYMDGVREYFESSQDMNILSPIRLDKYLREQPEESKQWFAKLVEFSDKLEKEKIKSSKQLNERRQSFSEILGL